MNFVQKYTGFLRRIKLFYFFYNLFHRTQLKRNKKIYHHYGLNRSVYRSISSKFLKNLKGNIPWLDKGPSLQEIEDNPTYILLPENIREGVKKWHKNGFIYLPNFISENTVNVINKDIDTLLENNTLDFNYTNRKIFNAYKQSTLIYKLITHPTIIDSLSFILGKKVIPFQTINFIKSSEQKPHSDFFHMSTFPKGYSIAIWIALEDIHDEAGALAYFPTSHRLNYITNSDYNNTTNTFLLDNNANEKYEKKVAEIIAENNILPQKLLAKKGDVFIWHHNLLHQGLPIVNNNLTRKSMVIHYYAKDVICFHEISERPAIFDLDLYPNEKDIFYDGADKKSMFEPFLELVD